MFQGRRVGSVVAPGDGFVGVGVGEVGNSVGGLHGGAVLCFQNGGYFLLYDQ